ncbi:hypothetical protein [Nitratireductor basaltis]|uniref:hypothetical protein n=1 Tax=Nitratireductor basaltis TaxID=472175 RepID=UPI0012687E33|nr:hypothetical protein [Nitratireductor basaltis]
MAEEDEMRGSIAVFDRAHRKVVKKWLREKMETFDADAPWPALREHFSLVFQRYSILTLNFTLKRTGEVSIGVENVKNEFYATKNGEDIDHILASQGYFFLRDLFHTHKFHSPTTDTIIDVYRDREDWKREVNYALARKVIALRRQNTVRSIRKAIGVLSYLEAFRKHLLDEQQRKDVYFAIPTTRKSLEAALPIVEIKEENSVRKKLESFAGYSQKVLALLFLYFGLFRDGVSPSEDWLWAKAVISAVQNDLLISLAILGFVSLVIQIMANISIPEREDFQASLVRLSLAFQEKKASAVMFVVGMTISLLCIIGIGILFQKITSVPV